MILRRRVHQFSPIVRNEDAVGNQVYALHQVFCSMGFDSRVYATRGGTIRGVPIHTGNPCNADLLIVHYSHWAEYLPRLLSSRCRKVLLYHNVTPDDFFRGLHPGLKRASLYARAALGQFSESVDCAVAHSAFSVKELRDNGYSRVVQIPYLFWEPSYQRADPDVLAFGKREDWRTLLAVGRVSPHKRLEYTLFLLDYLVRYVDERWRLILVGGAEDFAVHLLQLRELERRLSLDRVIFTGHVPQAELVAYYKIAEAFVCMSEHEGFGAPLLEAMRFDVPVFARATSAVPEIVKEAGVLFPPDAEIPAMAESIARVTADDDRRRQIVASQQTQLQSFHPHQVTNQWRELLTSLIPN